MRLIYIVSTTNFLISKAEVATSETSRLLRVVLEVSLYILIGVVTDDLDRVFISTHGTITTKTVEHTLISTVIELRILLYRKRGKGYIIYDTYGEVILWLG
ncbi:Uncharacterised protein [Chlamydia trachomatis]|nr:Uncharacterised protein [Chlamydia trachomatis]